MVPDFILKDLPQKETLGEKLRCRRKELKIELSEAENETKIRRRYLESLEKNEWEKLPSNVYIKGFLKKYCQFLGLDYSKFLEEYKREMGIKTNIKNAPGRYKKEFVPKSPRFVITPKTLVILVFLGGIFATLFYLGWQFRTFVAPPKLELISPAQDLTITSDFIEINGKTDSGSLLFINDTPLETDPDGAFKSKIALKEGLNSLKIASKNNLDRTSQIIRNILVASGTSKNQVSQPVVGLTLQAKTKEAASWVKVESDGKEIFQGIILADALRVFTANEKIKLFAGNAKAVFITLTNEKVQNKELGILSNLGDVTKGIEFLKYQSF